MMGYGGYNISSTAAPSGKGGFVSPNPFASPAEGTPKQRQSAQQSLRPVTVQQLLEATSQFPDAPLIVDNKEISQVSLLGRVVKSSINSSNFQYVIDDGTGTIDIRHYIDHEEESEVIAEPEGSYIKVVGQIRVFNERKVVSAYKIIRVTKIDEITNHNLSCMLVHLELKNGTKKNKGQSNNLQGQFGIKGVNYDHLTPLQNQILNVGLKYESEVDGASVNDFVRDLRGIAGEEEIRFNLSALLDHGHLYNPGDDEHFKVSEDAS